MCCAAVAVRAVGSSHHRRRAKLSHTPMPTPVPPSPPPSPVPSPQVLPARGPSHAQAARAGVPVGSPRGPTPPAVVRLRPGLVPLSFPRRTSPTYLPQGPPSAQGGVGGSPSRRPPPTSSGVAVALAYCLCPRHHHLYHPSPFLLPPGCTTHSPRRAPAHPPSATRHPPPAHSPPPHPSSHPPSTTHRTPASTHSHTHPTPRRRSSRCRSFSRSDLRTKARPPTDRSAWVRQEPTSSLAFRLRCREVASAPQTLHPHRPRLGLRGKVVPGLGAAAEAVLVAVLAAGS